MSPTLVAATERMYSACARRAGDPVARADSTMRSIHSSARLDVTLVEDGVGERAFGQARRVGPEAIGSGDGFFGEANRGVEVAAHERPVGRDRDHDRESRMLLGTGHREGDLRPRGDLVAHAAKGELAQ